MKRPALLAFFGFLLFLIILSGPGASQGFALTPEEVIARIQNQYNKAGGFKAWFRQESRLKGSTQGETAAGWVHFKKPLRMRWQYETPPEQKKEVISDGKQVWMYLPQDRLAMVYPLDKVLRSDLVMRFFSGMGRFRQEFDISWNRPPKEGSHLVIDLVPHKPQAELKRLTLTINPKTYQVERLEFSNALGEETRFAFSRIQMDFRAPPGFFSFTPPPGVQVVRESPS